MTAWALHVLAASVLLALAARLGESALLPLGRQVRWIWLAALAGIFVVPAATRLAPKEGAPVAEAFTSAPAWAAVTAAAPEAGADRPFAIRVPERLDRNVAAVWLATSAAAALGLFGLLARLALAGRRWRRERVDGTDVLISPDEGPAVFGVVRARIVIPAWLLGCSPAERRLVLAHERQHAAAGDQRLLALGFLLVGLAPWNPVAWWMLLRLRLAVEVDCDRRVLRASRDVRAYGAMLLGVAGRSQVPALSAAFIEPASFLRRRIVAMTTRRPPHARLRGGLLASGAAALGVLACEVAPPTELQVEPAPAPYVAEATNGEAPMAAPPEQSGAAAAVASYAESVEEEQPVSFGRPAEVEIGSVEVGILEETRIRMRASEIGPPAPGAPAGPLIYIDGVRVDETGMGRLDPDHIERVEVIKGPAAARVIGAEASRGVVRIYTKEASGRGR